MHVNNYNLSKCVFILFYKLNQIELNTSLIMDDGRAQSDENVDNKQQIVNIPQTKYRLQHGILSVSNVVERYLKRGYPSMDDDKDDGKGENQVSPFCYEVRFRKEDFVIQHLS